MIDHTGVTVGTGMSDAKPYRSTYLSHAEIYVSNYAKSIRFYDKILVPLGWKRLVCQKDRNHCIRYC